MEKSNPASEWNPAEHIDVDQRHAQMAEMRERCPVAYTDRHGPGWDILLYDDVVRIAADPQRFSNAGEARYERAVPPLEYDPPAHRDFRRSLAVFFTPKRIKLLEPLMRQNARDLLAPMLDKGEGDLAQGLAYPLPVLALCALLDIPANKWREIKELSEKTLLHASHDPDEKKLAWESHQKITAYAHELIADRRANPRNPEEDITSAYMNAVIQGEKLDDDLIAAALRLLISAGHNSTTSAIGNCMLRLAQEPETQALLRAEPSRIPAAVEEFLRLDTPVEEMPRWALEDVDIRGRKIAAGSRIGLFWASANRDEMAFPNADQCLIGRKPNRHVAFGHGIHTCVGAPLARMELQVALEEILRATTHFAVSGEVERPPFHRIGVTRLPVRLEC